MKKQEVQLPLRGYMLFPVEGQMLVPVEPAVYRGVERDPFVPLLIEGEMDPTARPPESSPYFWQYYPAGWRQDAYKLYEENLVPNPDPHEPFLLFDVEVARKIQHIIGPHMGYHEIIHCEISPIDSVPAFREPKIGNFLGYDVAYCGGDYFSAILHGLFKTTITTGRSETNLVPSSSLVLEFKALLNEFGLFSNPAPIPRYMRRYKEGSRSEADADYYVYRLAHVD